MASALRRAADALTDRLAGQLERLNAVRRANTQGVLELFGIGLSLPDPEIDYRDAANAFAAGVAEGDDCGVFLGLDLAPKTGRPHFYGFVVCRGQNAAQLKARWCAQVGGMPKANWAQRVTGQAKSWAIGASPDLELSLSRMAVYAIKPLPGATDPRKLVDNRLIASGSLREVLDRLLDDFEAANAWVDAPDLAPRRVAEPPGELPRKCDRPGCGRPVPPGSRRDRRYCAGGACRQQAYKERKRGIGGQQPSPGDTQPAESGGAASKAGHDPTAYLRDAAMAYSRQAPDYLAYWLLDVARAEEAEAEYATDAGIEPSTLTLGFEEVWAVEAAPRQTATLWRLDPLAGPSNLPADPSQDAPAACDPDGLSVRSSWSASQGCWGQDAGAAVPLAMSDCPTDEMHPPADIAGTMPRHASQSHGHRTDRQPPDGRDDQALAGSGKDQRGHDDQRPDEAVMEGAVATLACTDREFFGAAGASLAPDLFGTKPARLAVRALLEIVRAPGRGFPARSMEVIEAVGSCHGEDGVATADRLAVIEMMDDAEDAGLPGRETALAWVANREATSRAP